MKIKVIYLNETKRIQDAEDFEALIKQTQKAFSLDQSVRFGEQVKFFYIDSDYDVISVTSQDDLDEFFEAMRDL
jgi:hypothetical protein